MRVDRPQPRRDQRVGSRGDLALELLVERRCRGRDGHTALEVLAMQSVGRRAAHGVHAGVGRVGGRHLHALIEEAQVLIAEAHGRGEVARDAGERVAGVAAHEADAARAAAARRPTARDRALTARDRALTAGDRELAPLQAARRE